MDCLTSISYHNISCKWEISHLHLYLYKSNGRLNDSHRICYILFLIYLHISLRFVAPLTIFYKHDRWLVIYVSSSFTLADNHSCSKMSFTFSFYHFHAISLSLFFLNSSQSLDEIKIPSTALTS
jgi:hypothetical protein